MIRRGTRYTGRPVLPIEGDAAKDPYVDGDRRRIKPELITPADQDPTEQRRPFEERDRELTYGAPLEYQAPITLRVGLKSTSDIEQRGIRESICIHVALCGLVTAVVSGCDQPNPTASPRRLPSS